MSASSAPVEVVSRTVLSAESRLSIRALAARVEEADGVAALSEAFVLALAGSGGHITAASGGEVVGYAGVGPDGSAELLVDPGSRRHGVGGALWREARTLGAERVWAHGDLAPARGFAEVLGLTRVRELHVMSRPLSADDAAEPVLPEGFSVRTFVPGADEDRLLALNAAAFADHPEQGRLVMDDLRQRMDQEWFDPGGFFLVEDETAPASGPIAFHWTKVEPGPAAAAVSGGEGGPPEPGEVYVVGVHPAYQGRGLARPLTRLGIAHLARRGLGLVELYVDGDNARAIATYEREGFVIASTDAMYAVSAARMRP